MKRFISGMLAAVVLSTTTGCFGEFGLTRKVYNFNQGASDNKFVRTVLMYGLMIIPVYEVAALIDVLILNLVEFWSGSNPVAMQEGEFEKQHITYEGEEYVMEATKNQFRIYKAGQECDATVLYFNEAENSWSIAGKGVHQKLISLEGTETDPLYRVYDKDGSSYVMEVPEEAMMNVAVR